MEKKNAKLKEHCGDYIHNFSVTDNPYRGDFERNERFGILKKQKLSKTVKIAV